MENLINLQEEGQNKILKIGDIVIETMSIPGGAGVRTAIIKSDFKNIISVNLCGFTNKGQTQEYLMRQVLHGGIEQIVRDKRVELYSAGTQTILLTITGTI